MINKIPFLGWILSFIAPASLSVPFYFIWSSLAPIYFADIVPVKFLNIPFWHCVGLFIVIPIVRDLFTPRFVNVSNSCSK